MIPPRSESAVPIRRKPMSGRDTEYVPNYLAVEPLSYHGALVQAIITEDNDKILYRNESPFLVKIAKNVKLGHVKDLISP